MDKTVDVNVSHVFIPETPASNCHQFLVIRFQAQQQMYNGVGSVKVHSHVTSAFTFFFDLCHRILENLNIKCQYHYLLPKTPILDIWRKRRCWVWTRLDCPFPRFPGLVGTLVQSNLLSDHLDFTTLQLFFRRLFPYLLRRGGWSCGRTRPRLPSHWLPPSPHSATTSCLSNHRGRSRAHHVTISTNQKKRRKWFVKLV